MFVFLFLLSLLLYLILIFRHFTVQSLKFIFSCLSTLIYNKREKIMKKKKRKFLNDQILITNNCNFGVRLKAKKKKKQCPQIDGTF